MSKLHIEVTVQDELTETCMTWFEGLEVQHPEKGSTSLSGEVPDYAALYGLLERFRDLNLHLVTVQVQTISQKGTEK